MKQVVIAWVMLTLSIGYSIAQQTVTGTVKESSGDPLAGVTVLVKGTTFGTYSDDQGRYRIEVPNNNSTIVFSFIGKRVVEEALNGRTSIDVVMEEDALLLDEVLVTGYNTVRRKDVTGSVSSVSGADFVDVPVIGVQNALQGRTPGVQVTKNSGTPGGGVDVRVRGTTSISASSQPLFVIDGVPLVDGDFSQNGVGGAVTNSLSDINPNDIESIEVLKDASTAAIYGSRGANGVVLITTKKGLANKTQVSLNSSYGFQEAWNTLDMLDSTGYYEFIGAVFGSPGAVDKLGGNTNWQDEIFRQGAVTDNQLSISGGTQTTRFYASLGYYDEEGIVKNTDFKRYSGRLNVDHRASDKFKMGMNLSFTNSIAGRVQNDNNIYGAVSTAILQRPDLKILNDDGTYATDFGLENPVAAVTEYQNHVTTNRIVGNLFGEYEILKGLSIRATVGSDILSYQEEVYEPVILQSAAGSNGRGFYSTNTYQRWLTEYTLNYRKIVGKNNFSALAGTGYQGDNRKGSFIDKVGFPSPAFTTLDAAATVTDAESDFSGNELQSYFANAFYSFDDKYIVNATFRADGYSAFGEDNRFGYFPGVSAAWRISSEKFMNIKAINDLKLRVGWGVTGNNNIPNFAARSLYFAGANYLDQPGTEPAQIGNRSLKWETTDQLNIGLDFTLVNSRISGSVDYFQKNTSDLLLNRPIPTTSGFLSVFENIGSMENKGVEFDINTLNITGEFKWTTNFNISFIRNEVTELFEDQPIDVGFSNRIAVGQSIGTFYGHVTDGLFQNQGEVDAHAVQTAGRRNTKPGDIRFKDLNGDGTINDDDRDFIGSAQPDFIGGLTNALSYKGIELNFFLQYSYGNEVFNNNRVFSEGFNSVFNQTTAFNDRWKQEGDQTDIPRAVRNDPNNNRRDSDRFVEDGSYIRLKTATLSYTLPGSVVKLIGLNKVRLYVAGQNLITLTDYSGFDPEVNTFDQSNTALGTDFLTYPQARSYIGGVQIDF